MQVLLSCKDHWATNLPIFVADIQGTIAADDPNADGARRAAYLVRMNQDTNFKNPHNIGSHWTPSVKARQTYRAISYRQMASVMFHGPG